MHHKKRLRTELMALRAGISLRDRCIAESGVAMTLLRLPEYIAADTLLCYISSPEEFSTMAVIAHAIGIGKRVGVPRWSGGKMVFCEFNDYCALSPDRMGLLQPSDDAVVINEHRRAVCVVPALAADRRGFRIGYGGGYYDRFLAGFTGFSVVPLFDRLLLDAVPTEPHDLPVDCVVTPTILLRTKGDNL